MSGTFEDLAVWDWMLHFFEPAELPYSTVMTTGSGPVDEFEFDEYLKKLSLQPHHISANLDVVIFGRDDWDAEEIDELISQRRGRTLKIYSQEMVFAYLLTSQDPYDSPEILETFAEGHPALEYIRDNSFHWPTTTIVPSHQPRSFALEASPKESVLAKLGYRTGRTAPGDEGRRKALKTAYESGALPFVESEEHMAGWGKASSAQRLSKIANHLAATVKLQKRRPGQDLRLAISEREADLGWLKRAYYDGRYDFFWPSIED